MRNPLSILEASFERFGKRLRWEKMKAGVRDELHATNALKTISFDRETILVFSPEGGVTPHFTALCVMGKTLQELGHQVVMVHCLDLFARCPVLDTRQLPQEISPAFRDQLCYGCAKAGMKMAKAYGLPGIDLRTLLTPQVQADYDRATAEFPDRLRDYTFDSFLFGELCGMNLALRFKVSDFDQINEEVRAGWTDYIKSSVMAYLLCSEMFRSLPIKGTFFYNDYPICLGVRLAAAKHGVSANAISHPGHKNIDRQTVLVFPSPVVVEIYRLPGLWPRWRDLALPTGAVDAAVEDLLFRLKSFGSHNYSPAKSFEGRDIRTQLGLSTKKTTRGLHE